ncbi:MAG: isochorismate synthase [Actinobacteria bacterium]|jgi:salicylate biosynthesis isochorismate synthase/menaquinone-specific isochorismate synthase|nr:isochorismate synthase [Actinomycetota bacterium]MBT3746596.1 isochorismate synthase [Actinomycetota bacterium]MBT5117579.1 isochorismate synthase [Actinomycetota bacterium]MBT5505299.1 isochorismate synthase [Actinomycetota bacterium]MBT6970449.1 isochorismate synthase [Actinomycetota bacterium]
MALAAQPLPHSNHIATTVALDSGPATDPLAWLSSAPADAAHWYWEIPDDDISWVGLGQAQVQQVSGQSRFDQAAQFAHQTFANLTVNAPTGAPAPRLAAGFSFDDHGNQGPWASLGAGLVVLPAVQVLRHKGKTWLTTIDKTAELLPTQPAPAPDPLPDVDPAHWSNEASRRHYRNLVSTALNIIEGGSISKAVPCRSLAVPHRPDLGRLLSTLRHTYPACATFCVGQGTTNFVGATPERLAAVNDQRLFTAALAGSAPRHPAPATDAALGQGLITSPKERAEHSVVVDAVGASLRQLEINPQHPEHPELLRLHGIQHLYTPIEADLDAGTGLLDIVGALHPTPAVSGHPVAPSASLRAQHEEMDRGWFASPLGWFDQAGQGEFRVALRSALLTENGTTLYAGAGVVKGSDPDRELLETDMKLQAMLAPIVATASNK